MKRFAVSLLVLVLGISSSVFAESVASAPLTIEELYLESEISLEVIESQLFTNSRELQRLALTALEDQVLNGSVDTESDEYVEMVSTTVAQGVTIISNNRYRLPDSYHPQIRIAAARLLGYSEHPSAQDALLTVLRADPEPTVRAQAAHSLGRIGSDPGQKVSFVLGKALRNQARTMHDETFVFAALSALQQIGNEVGMRNLHTLVHESAIEIATGNFNRLLRDKAIEILVQL